MTSKQAQSLPLHEVERIEEEQIREVARLLLQTPINARGHGGVGHAVQRADGKMLTQHRLRERGYMSIFGRVKIGRLAYGAQGACSVMPLDEQLNLPWRSYSYELQKRVTRQGELGLGSAYLGFQIDKPGTESKLSSFVTRWESPSFSMTAIVTASFVSKRYCVEMFAAHSRISSVTGSTCRDNAFISVDTFRCSLSPEISSR